MKSVYNAREILCTTTFESEMIFTSSSWAMLESSSDHRALDTLIFDVLDLTQYKLYSVYEAIINHVGPQLR